MTGVQTCALPIYRVRVPRSMTKWALTLNVSRPSLHRELRKLEAMGFVRYRPPDNRSPSASNSSVGNGPSPTRINADKKCELLQYSLPLISNGVSWWIVNAADRMIIAALLGVTAIMTKLTLKNFLNYQVWECPVEKIRSVLV